MDDDRTSHQIYRSLFDRIIRREYECGTWLREDTIAVEFNASRTPVRTALQQLAADGLVRSIPKRGSTVVGFTVDDLEEAYEIRKVLELLALERGLPSLRIAELSRIRARMEEAERTNDPIVHAETDTAFHQLIIESSASPRLTGMLEGLYRIMHAFRELGFANHEIREAAAEEHFALVDAIAARDRERSAKLLGDHIARSKSRILAEVLRSGL